MRTIKFEIKLKCILPINGYRTGEELIITNDIFNTQNGIAFFPIDSGFKIVYKRQFTGLLDKNGKEIYEGDIVRLKGGRKPRNQERPYYETEVVYQGNGFYLKENKSVWIDSAAVRNVEVIGNVYENPELLKKTK